MVLVLDPARSLAEERADLLNTFYTLHTGMLTVVRAIAGLQREKPPCCFRLFLELLR